MEGKLQDEFLESKFDNALDFLKDKVKRYENAIEYIDRAIYTQHCTMNHMENTEYEKGKIRGLIEASNIIEKGLRRECLKED